MKLGKLGIFKKSKKEKSETEQKNTETQNNTDTQSNIDTQTTNETLNNTDSQTNVDTQNNTDSPNKNIYTEQKDAKLNKISCPSCGGSVDIKEGQVLVTCPYCRTKFKVTQESADFTIDRGVLVKYSGDDREVEVPQSVKAIGINAFSNKKKLTKIILPEEIIELQGAVFLNCSRLEKIILPDSLEEIPRYTFSGCKSLESISLPKNLKYLGDGAFNDCKSLKSIEIPPNVKSVKINTFINCKRLKTVYYYEQTKIGKDSFMNCNKKVSLKILDLPVKEKISEKETIDEKKTPSYEAEKSENISSENDEVFQLNKATCTSCGASVDIEEGQVLVTCPFCQTQFKVTKESSDFTIDNGVLMKYNGKNREVEVPSGVKSINMIAFFQQSTLTKITLPEGVTEVLGGSFIGCTNLEEIILPESLENIGDGTFNECRSLTSIEIPPNVKSVDIVSFTNCESLKTISYYEQTKIEGEYIMGCENLSSLNMLDPNTKEIISKKRIISAGDGLTYKIKK